MATMDKKTAKTEVLNYLKLLEIDIKRGDKESQKLVDDGLKKLVKYVMMGRLTFEDETAIYEPRKPPENTTEPIRIKEPVGEDYMSMRYKEGMEMTALFKMLEKITDKTNRYLGKLVAGDIAVLKVFFYFLSHA